MPRRLLAASFATLACTGVAAKPFRVDVAPGKVGEVCMPLQAGDTLAWRFKASAAADFNLHHHVDNEVLMPVERKQVREDTAEHAIDRANDWCLMWTAPAGQRMSVEGRWSVRRGGAASAPK